MGLRGNFLTLDRLFNHWSSRDLTTAKEKEKKIRVILKFKLFGVGERHIGFEMHKSSLSLVK